MVVGAADRGHAGHPGQHAARVLAGRRATSTGSAPTSTRRFPNWTGSRRFYRDFGGKPFTFGEWALWGGDDPGFVRQLFGWIARPSARADGCSTTRAPDRRAVPPEPVPALRGGASQGALAPTLRARRAGRVRLRMDLSKLTRSEFIAALGGILLGVGMFLPWYETDTDNPNAVDRRRARGGQRLGGATQ